MTPARWVRLWALVVLWLCGAQAASAQHTTWYFAEGATGGFEQDLLIANPTASTAQVRVTFLTPTAPPNILTFDVAPTSRKTIRVNDVPGLVNAEVSSVVESLNGVPIAAERTMYWGGAAKRGGHNATGIEAPRTEWHLAEGATGSFFHTYILLANPNAQPTSVTVDFLRDDGTVSTQTVTVPANRRHSMDVNGLPGMATSTFGAKIISTLPILAERAMYWSSFEGGSSAPAIPSPATTWLFAEGATLGGMQTFILLGNPNTAPTSATLTFLLESGTTVAKTVTVPALGRTTVAAHDYPEMAGVSFGTTVTSTLPIVAERAMYWGNFIDGHASAGVTQAATKWAFAEGREGQHEGVPFQTFFLFSNPSPTTPITVHGTFYLADGTGSVYDITVPAHARVTLYAGTPPRMAGQDMAAFFEADGPFIAERSSYWGADWYGGHGSVGIPWSGPIVTPPLLPRAALPVFVTPGGTYQNDLYAELSTSTPGGVVRYTTNGTDPVETSAAYGGPIFLSESTTIKAKTFAANHLPSATATAAYTLQAPPPIFAQPSGDYASPIDFAISSALPNSHIRYSTDGSEPTESHAVYTGPIHVNDAMTLSLKAKAFRYNWTPSSTVSVVYQVSRGVLQTPAPTPAAGLYEAGQTVTLTAQTFATIHYTTDGSDPTTASPAYAGPITLNAPTTIKARAFYPSYTPSALLEAQYAMKVAKPTIDPGSTALAFPNTNVTVATTTADATLRYTIDRTNPSETSPQTFGSVTVSPGVLLQVRAYKTGWTPSDLAFAAYSAEYPATSPGEFTLVGIDESAFYPTYTNVTFQLMNAPVDNSSIKVFRNYSPVSSSGFAVAQSMAADNVVIASVTVPGLVDGRNVLEVYGTDLSGLEVYTHNVVWAGPRTATIRVTNSTGTALSGAAVRLVLLADDSVAASGVTNGSGNVQFQSIPTHEPFQVEVALDRYRTTTATLNGGATSLTVALTRHDLAFEGGNAAWTGDAENYPHYEGMPPLFPCPGCPPRGLAAASALTGQAMTNGTNNDILVQTFARPAGEGTLRFVSSPGARRARVRYRFWTVEPLNGPMPDSLTIQLRSITSGQAATDARNAVTLVHSGTLDANGFSTWQEMSLPLLQDGETVELSVRAANAGDLSFDSAIVIDYVEEDLYRVDAFQLFDFKDATHNHPRAVNERLRYLSAAPHAYWSGRTRVNGTLTIRAPEGAQVSAIDLDIFNGATRVATAALVPELAPTLLRTVGADGIVSLTANQWMFAIDSAQFSALTLGTGVSLTPKVRVTFANGQTATRELGRTLPAFGRFLGAASARTGTRDVGNCTGLRARFPCGGDDWADPRTLAFIGSVGGDTRWNDFSNMNGGEFPPHHSHETGFDIDGTFPNYNPASEATALTMLGFLNQHGRKIANVFVTYAIGDDFYEAIKNVTLTDGRSALSVITIEADHVDHFHWRLDPAHLP